MIRLDRPVVVEGKYDKSKLSSFIDAVIVTTDGFGVFSDSKRLSMIRALAQDRGVILLTDSDTSGFRIRNFLKGALGKDKITHIYIPDVYGKERRKPHPSSEGKLGVEGMPRQMLLDAFRHAGVVCGEDMSASAENGARRISKCEMYELGLTGGPNSAARRGALLRKLNLPERMSTNALCEILGALYTEAALAAEVAGLGE